MINYRAGYITDIANGKKRAGKKFAAIVVALQFTKGEVTIAELLGKGEKKIDDIGIDKVYIPFPKKKSWFNFFAFYIYCTYDLFAHS